MKKQTQIIPDKIIELPHGDKIRIYVEKNKIVFCFSCDGTGNEFELTKGELWKWIK